MTPIEHPRPASTGAAKPRRGEPLARPEDQTPSSDRGDRRDLGGDRRIDARGTLGPGQGSLAHRRQDQLDLVDVVHGDGDLPGCRLALPALRVDDPLRGVLRRPRQGTPSVEPLHLHHGRSERAQVHDQDDLVPGASHEGNLPPHLRHLLGRAETRQAHGAHGHPSPRRGVAQLGRRISGWRPGPAGHQLHVHRRRADVQGRRHGSSADPGPTEGRNVLLVPRAEPQREHHVELHRCGEDDPDRAEPGRPRDVLQHPDVVLRRDEGGRRHRQLLVQAQGGGRELHQPGQARRDRHPGGGRRGPARCVVPVRSTTC